MNDHLLGFDKQDFLRRFPWLDDKDTFSIQTLHKLYCAIDNAFLCCSRPDITFEKVCTVLGLVRQSND
jgi:hypothetical protein